MKKTIYMIIILLSTQCYLFHPKWAKTTLVYQPVKEEYKMHKQKFVFSDIIDTSAIYIHQDKYIGQYEKEFSTQYLYRRFSSNGIVFGGGFTKEHPTPLIYNDLNEGQYEFYQILKDSIIKIEMYNFHLRMFEYDYYKVLKNGDLLFYKSHGRPFGTWKSKENMLFIKKPAQYTKPLVFPE